MKASRSKEKTTFAQVDANLDLNPKIRKAGRDGREVFEFILRRNAAIDGNGSVAIKYIDPDYLADILMMSPKEAANGTKRAASADLIKLDTDLGVVWIIGWTEEWGRKAKSGAQRTETWREREKERSSHKPSESLMGRDVSNEDVTTCDGGDESNDGVTVGDESDALRVEKSREERESGKPDNLPPAESAESDRVAIFASAAVGEINRIAATRYQPDAAETVKNCTALVKRKFTPAQAVAVIRSKRDWLSDERMLKHFNPSTLLRPSKFASYSDDLEARRPVARDLTPDEPPDFGSAYSIQAAP